MSSAAATDGDDGGGDGAAVRVPLTGAGEPGADAGGWEPLSKSEVACAPSTRSGSFWQLRWSLCLQTC